jgi:hypothetical protein
MGADGSAARRSDRGLHRHRPLVELVPGAVEGYDPAGTFFGKRSKRILHAPCRRSRRGKRDRDVQILLPQFRIGGKLRRPARSEFHTVGNAKRTYRDLLEYFASRTDKLFIVITAPPLLESDTSPEQAANARALNRWLVEEWLAGYPYSNVAVFDFYNVLTSNGGDANTNDLGSAGGNHHRCNNGRIEYISDQGSNTSAYAENGDSHPTPAGNQKATGEYVPLLNFFYHHWRGER